MLVHTLEGYGKMGNLLNIIHFTQSDIDYDDALYREVSGKL